MPAHRPLLASLLILLVACGGGGDDSPSTFANAGATCRAGQTACNAERTRLFACEQADGDATATWHSDGNCAITCASSRDAAGLSHDYCVDCQPAEHHCIGGVLYSCTAAGRWVAAGPSPAKECPGGAGDSHARQLTRRGRARIKARACRTKPKISPRSSPR
jgi:hypothetical protein